MSDLCRRSSVHCSAIAGHKDKVNLSWKVTPDAMVYATYSEGFRPGGFNRGRAFSPSSPLFGKFVLPFEYDTDTLKNYELGWKTSWFGHHLQFNGAVYQEDWDNVQMEIFAPEIYGNNAFTANGPDYRVRGLEGDVIWRATEKLTINSSFAWNSSEQRTVPSVRQRRRRLCLFPTAGIGSPLAQAPPSRATCGRATSSRRGATPAPANRSAAHGPFLRLEGNPGGLRAA